jgi:Conserved TM helix
MDFNSQRFTHLADLAWSWAAHFVPRLGAAVLILGVGFVAARWLSRAVNAALARAPHVDR